MSKTQASPRADERERNSNRDEASINTKNIDKLQSEDKTAIFRAEQRVNI